MIHGEGVLVRDKNWISTLLVGGAVPVGLLVVDH